MKLRFLQKGENRLGEKVPTGIFHVVLCLFPLFIQLAAVPVEFFGADGNKIRETRSKEMNLPTIDPFEIPLLEFQQGSGNVSLHLTLKDFRINGFKHLSITRVKSNLNDNKFEISIECPSIVMEAQYSAEGGVFTFPISGQGDFYFNMTDVAAVLIFRLTTSDTLPGLRFFVVEDALMDLLPSEINAHFGDSIDGSNAIGDAFNTFFNKNALEIFTIVKPKFSGILAKIFAAFANEILSRHPEDVLLPD